MVSFQCNACGDTLKKPKLDQHRGRCQGANFTCLDCLTDFRGTDYRGHTSCITEDQKYQGHLYREKPAKQATSQKRKSVSIVEPVHDDALVHTIHHAYVEDAHDVDSGTPTHPPHVPSPPSAIRDESPSNINVFDFLVSEESTSTSKQIVLKGNGRNNEELLNSAQYETDGFTYGAEPVPPGMPNVNASLISLDYMTPAAKATKAKRDNERPAEMDSVSHSRTNSGAGSTSEKKRKRAQTEAYIHDTLMKDAPETAPQSRKQALVHSGLTGGLGRMMPRDDGSLSTDDHEYNQKEKRKSRRQSHYEDTRSPLKKSRRSRGSPQSQSRNRGTTTNSNGLGISIKGRASKVISMVGSGSVLAALANPAAAHNQGTSQASVRKSRRSSDESYDRNGRNGSQARGERKRHRVVEKIISYHPDTGRTERIVGERSCSPEASRRKGRALAIEYYPDKQHREDSISDDSVHNERGQMVVFGSAQKTAMRCESFLQFVTKGSGSEKGYSVNKLLKRWHRDAGFRQSEEKLDEEKELWKGLRLKRNDRGEIVVVF